MNSLRTKLAVSALLIAALAAPAFAQGHHQRRVLEDYAGNAVIPQTQPLHYPNGAVKTGTAANVQSGAIFNQGY